MELKDRFKEVRLAEKLSLAGFGARLNITKDKVFSIESGRQKVPGEMLEKIVAVFAIDAYWLLAEVGQMYQSDQPATNETPAIYRSDIIDNRHQSQITAFIENWYKTSSDEEKVWMNIQMQRCFPEFKEFIADSKADSSSQKKQAGE